MYVANETSCFLLSWEKQFNTKMYFSAQKANKNKNKLLFLNADFKFELKSFVFKFFWFWLSGK